MLEAYVTNLGKYNEGYVIGEYLKLPATTEEVQALLKRIGVDGVRYEEIFMTNYETDISGLHDCLDEYESIDELNYLASLLDDMPEWEAEKFAAALEFGEYHSAKDLINLAQNLDGFELYTGIADEKELGRYYIEEMCALEVPEHVQSYIDYEAYGRDMSINEDGRFTDGGYVVRTGDSFTEHYSGRDDLPEEHRIFAYPKPEKASIRDALKQYQQLVDRVPDSSKSRPAPSFEER